MKTRIYAEPAVKGLRDIEFVSWIVKKIQLHNHLLCLMSHTDRSHSLIPLYFDQYLISVEVEHTVISQNNNT